MKLLKYFKNKLDIHTFKGAVYCETRGTYFSGKSSGMGQINFWQIMDVLIVSDSPYL